MQRVRQADILEATSLTIIQLEVRPMTEHFEPRTEIINDEDGRQVASADIEVVEKSARTSFRVEAGHVAVGTRERLVDAVLDSPEVNATHQIEAVIPMGDADMLQRIQERCDSVEPRAAGASCLIDAEISNIASAPDLGEDAETN